MIDIKINIEAGFLLRWMSVKRMKQILNQLDDNDLLYPNRVGNLTVVRNNKENVKGYIDFNSEEYNKV